uniref:NADH dehydrogenase subunit 5 n=1 Tax=Bulinus truncatus TaxID=55810 RepID=UPI001EDFA0FD|nr:NADH dehydrogenase subunit 5 [Bulinus truncatus]QYJ56630.1 NADH dehydrogenase subunit 5 [Bulinus truncatus]
MPFMLFSLSIFFSMCFMLVVYYNKFIIEVMLLTINSCEFSLSIYMDKTSLMFGVVVTLISGSVFLFGCKYMSEDPYFFRFKWILLSFVISMNFLIFSGSYIMMLLGWDGLGVTSFALIVYYQSKDSLIAGFQTLLLNRLGDALIVTSFFVFISFGQFLFSYGLQEKMMTLVLFLTLASLTKSAQFPFSSWLPAAMAAPTPVSALVHSSTLVTAGIYLILRMMSMFNFSMFLSNLLLLLGSVTCFLGGTAALFENDLKKIVALSTLSQLGLMVFTLGMGFPNMALFHLFTHAMFKALLFLSAGTILMSTFGTQDLRILGGISMSLPFCTVIFNISSLCLAGAPFLSAFYSKHVILEKMFFLNINMLSILLMSLGTVCTVFYSVRLMKNLCWSNPNMVLILKESSFLVNFPMMILSVFAMISGKMMFNIENWFLESQLIKMEFSMLINMFMIIGIILGMIFTINKKSMMLSTLFYLTPLYNNSSKLINPLIYNMMHLDYGWLEQGPKVNFYLEKFSNKFSLMFNWPKTNCSMYIFFMLILFFFFLMNGFYF